MLANNAGIGETPAPIDEKPAADRQRVIDTKEPADVLRRSKASLNRRRADR